MDQLPQYGEWHLSNNLFAADPPFAVLTVDFRSLTGRAKYWHQTVELGKVETTGANSFRAHYSINSQVGIFEAVYQDDQTLKMTFYGSVDTTCTARPVNLVGGERPVTAWSTGEKIQASIERSFPLLPGDVVQEIRGMLTPAALAIMAGVMVLWGISHFFAVGEVVDALLVVTGALLMGPVALEVAQNLYQFGTLSTGAKSQADLDAAARHFSVAVAKGGVQAVMAILMWRGARGRPRASKPAAPLEPPTNLNAVPPSRIPAASKVAAALAEMGEQPRLGTLGREVAEAVRAALSRLRRADLNRATAVDCFEGSSELQRIAGGVGDAMEHNARSPVSGWDHTMWRIVDEVVDTNPGGWRRYFQMFPEKRLAVEKAVAGLARRLEEGAVLTLAEFEKFMDVRRVPQSPMFSNAPVPRGKG